MRPARVKSILVSRKMGISVTHPDTGIPIRRESSISINVENLEDMKSIDLYRIANRSLNGMYEEEMENHLNVSDMFHTSEKINRQVEVLYDTTEYEEHEEEGEGSGEDESAGDSVSVNSDEQPVGSQES